VIVRDTMIRSAQRDRPRRVTYAVIALAAAWIVTATALAINQLVFHGSGIGPGPFLGIVSLALQAVVIALVARGSVVARAFVVLFFVLAVLPLQLVPRLVAEGSTSSAIYTVLGFVLKGVATVLLFTGESRRWFGALANGDSSTGPRAPA
jgi:hypothetical protein